MPALRLQKILSQAGVASRRRAEELIFLRRVRVNGVVVTKLGLKADPEKDQITVDGKPIKIVADKVTYLFHKPKNVMVTRRDPEGRPTIYDYLKEENRAKGPLRGRLHSLGPAKPDPRLSQGRSCTPLKPHRKESDRAWPVRFRSRGGSGEEVRRAAPPIEAATRAPIERCNPVGRLDFDSEGLLLLTNDGDLHARLTHPRHEIPKIYQAKISGSLSKDEIQKLKSGVDIGGYVTQPCDVKVIKQNPGNEWLEITLKEGKNRQIRRMIEALGHCVLRLVRVGIGPLRLGDLKKGEWRPLTAKELVNELFRSSGRGQGVKLGLER